MKVKYLLISASLLLFLFVGCEKDARIAQKDCYTASNGFCGKMCFNKNYGNNFEEALLILYEEKLDWSQLDSLIIELYQLNDVEDNKSRSIKEEFHMILFRNPINGQRIHANHDVLDESGNHYFILWCPD